MSEPVEYISLGAGVQSSCMALMASFGFIEPNPIAAIFSDTGDERAETLAWLDELEKCLSFPLYRVQRSVLSDHLAEWGHTQIPAFVGDGNYAAIGKRQCTKHWKIVPVQNEIRRITGTKGKRLPDDHFVQWIGISTNEVTRAKPSQEKWIRNRFPLLEHRMNRQDCIRWLADHNFPEPPRSSCVYCPYQSRAQWRQHKENPVAWAKIEKVDRQLESTGEFLTADLKRINDVDFRSDVQKGQREMNLFENECSGTCGV